jgi:hypothetical protein
MFNTLCWWRRARQIGLWLTACEVAERVSEQRVLRGMHLTVWLEMPCTCEPLNVVRCMLGVCMWSQSEKLLQDPCKIGCFVSQIPRQAALFRPADVRVCTLALYLGIPKVRSARQADWVYWTPQPASTESFCHQFPY